MRRSLEWVVVVASSERKLQEQRVFTLTETNANTTASDHDHSNSLIAKRKSSSRATNARLMIVVVDDGTVDPNHQRAITIEIGDGTFPSVCMGARTCTHQLSPEALIQPRSPILLARADSAKFAAVFSYHKTDSQARENACACACVCVSARRIIASPRARIALITGSVSFPHNGSPHSCECLRAHVGAACRDSRFAQTSQLHHWRAVLQVCICNRLMRDFAVCRFYLIKSNPPAAFARCVRVLVRRTRAQTQRAFLRPVDLESRCIV